MAPIPEPNAGDSKIADSRPKIADDAILVDDSLYSMTKLAANHPGGDLFVKAFGGRDATEAFVSYHRKLFPHDRVKHALLDTVQNNNNGIYTDDYLELCAEVEKVLPKHKSFATPLYIVKLIALLSFTVTLEYHLHSTGNYVWYLCGLLGWCYALIGLNIQHDANHGSISKISIINRILGYTQNYIGGSHIDWIHQHVVQHHIYCNDLHQDPDIMGSSVMRLNPLSSLHYIQKFQYLYIFVMIAGFGLSVVVTSMKHVLTNSNYTPMSKALTAYRSGEIFTAALFVGRWVAYPIASSLVQGKSGAEVVMVMLHILPLYLVAGFYLALFFLISHNFEGVHMFDFDAHDKTPGANSNNRFLYRQVVTSSNVGGPILAFINGGLNYQIEHHLFPRVQHSHYPTIAPIVKAFCAKKNIPYIHFATVYDNVLACSKHLYKMGNTPATENVEH